jgi:hypothetical protein
VPGDRLLVFERSVEAAEPLLEPGSEPVIGRSWGEVVGAPDDLQVAFERCVE